VLYDIMFSNIFLVEKNPNLTAIYKQKMGEYFGRAEYIKK